MTPEQLEQAQLYRKEFEDEKTSNERRAELIQWVQERAGEDGETQTCAHCKKYVVYLPWHEAVTEGHVYSYDGHKEYFITRLCEYCFDDITKEPDEDDTDFATFMGHPGGHYG